MIDPSSSKKEFWSKTWEKYVESYLKATPRTGLWLFSKFSLKGKKILELAGGSCRDSIFLANKKIDATGSDFDEKTIDYLNNLYPDCNKMVVDAFNTGFSSKIFDITFHNGLWVLFEKNEKIFELLYEQYRITKDMMILLVHNNHNNFLKKEFKIEAEKDPIYKIRFFDKNELRQIIKDSGIKYKSLKFEKFGGYFDNLYSLSKKFRFLEKFICFLVPKIYFLLPWSKVERIALIIKIK